MDWEKRIEEWLKGLTEGFDRSFRRLEQPLARWAAREEEAFRVYAETVVTVQPGQRATVPSAAGAAAVLITAPGGLTACTIWTADIGYVPWADGWTVVPLLLPGASVDVQNGGSAAVTVTVRPLARGWLELFRGLFARPLGPSPRKVATIPYTSFTTASTTIWPYFVGVLNRAARARTFLVFNGLNQPLTSLAAVIYDSQVVAGSPASSNNIPMDTPGVNAFVVNSSEEASASSRGRLAAHGDSLQIGLGMGATLPTQGAVTVYVTEVFD